MEHHPFTQQVPQTVLDDLKDCTTKNPKPIEENPMAEILHEVTIAAAPETVYKAITEQEGLTSWWAAQAVVQPQVGSVAECGFSGGFAIRMELTNLEPGRKVYWTVKDGVPDWIGTHVTYDLTPVDSSTRVRFGQRDFASAEGSLASASLNWAWYLISLKDYIETGKGRPDTTPNR
jgi:uncharacterized protein YndB with AHSA1/START domain